MSDALSKEPHLTRTQLLIRTQRYVDEQLANMNQPSLTAARYSALVESIMADMAFLVRGDSKELVEFYKARIRELTHRISELEQKRGAHKCLRCGAGSEWLE